MSTLFGPLLNALQSNGVASKLIPSILSSVASGYSVSSQVTSLLTQLQVLANNPTAYQADAPELVARIETIPGLPPTVLPLLEKLKTATDPLQVSQLISEIESFVNAQPSII